MGKNWEFTSSDEMLNYLVGHSYGPDPASKLEEIRAEKKKNAERILEWLELKLTDEVVEVGSGSGLISKFIAPQVGHLYCCDISQSFLKLAKKECAGILNISFNKIDTGGLDFLANNSIHAIFSHNVFIHLNLFEIYKYMRAFQRVVREGGIVWFDMSMAESFADGVPALFTKMSEAYHDKPSTYGGLLKWNSRAAVEAIAQECDFSLCTRRWDDNSLLLIKNKPGQSRATPRSSRMIGEAKWKWSKILSTFAK